MRLPNKQKLFGGGKRNNNQDTCISTLICNNDSKQQKQPRKPPMPCHYQLHILFQLEQFFLSSSGVSNCRHVCLRFTISDLPQSLERPIFCAYGADVTYIAHFHEASIHTEIKPRNKLPSSCAVYIMRTRFIMSAQAALRGAYIHLVLLYNIICIPLRFLNGICKLMGVHQSFEV